ncbi:MAG: hypothetical protein RIT25_255 [Planctomycetota bacterium]|jgi:choice-of-anchor B domain-containing protein
MDKYRGFSGVLLTVAALALPAAAQTRNCVLLGTFNQYAAYNDVWGYVAPNGKEYALLCATSGMVVVDCSNPAQPVQRGYFPWATSTWRDVRTYGTYAYVSSEAGAGFQVIDLSNPDAPTLVGYVGTANSGNAHNVCVDLGTGRLYLAGCNTGTPVYDLTVNPANPTFLGYALGSGNANYFHDLCAENGFAYGSMIYNGQLRIFDLAQGLPWTTALSSTSTPSTFTHNAWPNAAGTLVVTTDERAGGVVKFYDITNKAAPVAKGQFTPNPASIPHNAFIVGNLCHVSWYTEGYQCIDISDPMNPVQVASYDTWPGTSGGFNGAWGVYPFQPSGNIYVSDISTGLYIVRPQITDMALTHTPLPATSSDEDGPYAVDVGYTSSNALVSMTLNYRVNGGPTQSVPMAQTATPGTYRGNIPGQYAPSSVEYWVDAVDTAASRRLPSTGEYSFFIGSIQQVWFDNLETERGWTHGFVTSTDDWQRGQPFGRSGTSGGVGWTDPGSAYSGTTVWGNDLGGTGFNGSYPNGVSNWLQSPSIPTQGLQGLTLRYRRWLTLAAGDTARVLVNGTPVFSTASAVNDANWQLISHDISAIANTAANLTVRFELVTNGTNVSGGWTLDDIEVVLVRDCLPAVTYGAGTAGSGSILPGIGATGLPRTGASFSVDGTSLLGGAPALLGIAFQSSNLPVFGITALVDPNAAAFLFAIASGTAGVPGAGSASWTFSVPAVPSLDNLDLYHQVITLDSGSVGGSFGASQGLRARVCRN